MISLWTDGSAKPNPGPGGFSVIDEATGKPIAVGREDGRTSNIRMEGCALITAMDYANGRPCEIHTDSEFWINVLTKWAPTWKANNWVKRNGKIQNLDLVQKAYELYERGNVKLVWTRGHVGTRLNELADDWAKKARKGTKLN